MKKDRKGVLTKKINKIKRQDFLINELIDTLKESISGIRDQSSQRVHKNTPKYVINIKD